MQRLTFLCIMKTNCLFALVAFFIVHLTYSQSTKKDTLTEIKLNLFKEAKSEFSYFERKHGRTVATKNGKMHFLEFGEPTGIPLIWIHGSYTNAYEILHIVNQLASLGYYVIAIDYYGHGQTEIPEHEVSLYHVADDISDMMVHKGLEKAVIGGWSRGAYIATAFYDAYPQKVLGLVLEDGGSVAFNHHYHQLSVQELDEKLKEIFSSNFSYPSFETEFEAYQYYYDTTRSDSQFELLAWIKQDDEGRWTICPAVDHLFHMDNSISFEETILRPGKANLFARSLAFIEPEIIYRNLNVPMLILDPVSENDPFPNEGKNIHLKDQHPELIVHRLYQDTGHNLHFEAPENFVEDLQSFLDTIRKYWQMD